jgi:hypothetical protein
MNKLFIPRATYYRFDGNSIQDYSKTLWYEVPLCVHTSHMLIIQWDGWVINPQAWTDDFLSFDYIGAVWPWHKENRVGNGGFSLRSTKLMKTLIAANLSPVDLEDDNLCRRYRKGLELASDIRWADEPTANLFSAEHNYTMLIQGSAFFPFGFHDCRNWPRILSAEQLGERIIMCERNPHIRRKKEYQQLVGRNTFGNIFQKETSE